MRFSIRNLLWTTIVVAMGWGSWLDRSDLLVAADSSGPDATASNPDDGEAFLRQHRARLAKGELKAALANAEEQIRLRPALPHGYVARAILHVVNRDCRQAAADMQQAITKRGDDEKREVNAVLTREAIEHGENQVRALLKDRPVLAKHIHEKDAMWSWAVRRFAGEELGTLVDWDGAVPARMAGWCYPPREKRGHGRIQIHDCRFPEQPEKGKASFEELWHLVVFELHNIVEAQKDIPECTNEVFAGRMTKEQYISRFLAGEIRAAKKVQAFYAYQYLPWAADDKAPATDYSVWHVLSYWTSQWEHDIRDSTKYMAHRLIFAEYFDIVWHQKLLKEEKWAQAITFGKSLLPTMRHEEHQGSIYRNLASCYEAQNRWEDAIGCLNESIKRDPNQVTSYLLRGNIHLRAWGQN